jgi:Response regulator containing CheY-like receiver, AAA-type ATPase, and DNA-binding domains
MKFLSVDDSATMRKIISLALKGAGHTVEEAGNGREALAALERCKVDCILLDINMPEMNGIEFLHARKAKPDIAGVPVFVLTTQDEEGLRQEALSLGAKGFIVKPFQKEALLAAISNGI